MSDISFYETSAQVIPLLLLATVVETGFLKDLRPFESAAEHAQHALSDAILLPLAVVITFAGEVAALHVTLVGTASGIEQRLTGVALVLGFWGVFTPILNQVIAATMKHFPQDGGAPRGHRVAETAGRVASKVMHGAMVAIGILVLIGYTG
jgi:hypothetical protein